MKTKVCSKCGEAKPISCFHTDAGATGRDCIAYWCKTCVTARRIERSKDQEYNAKVYRRIASRRKRLNSKTIGRARYYKPWTSEDVAMLWQNQYTDQQIAEKLDRSYSAIVNARVRYCHLKPGTYVPNVNVSGKPAKFPKSRGIKHIGIE